MANPTLNFSSISLASAKIYTTSSNLATSFIRVRADFTNGQNTATVVDDVATYLGSGSIEPGMYLRSSGEFNNPTKITDYNPSTKVITLDGTSAASGTSQLSFITLPAGWVYVATASFSKPGGSIYNPPLDFREVTGSEDPDFQAGDLPWGIIGQLEATASAGTGLAGRYAQYTITRVTNRANSTTISFYATASNTINAFIEPTGYSLTYNQSFLLLSEISGSFMSVAGSNDLSGGGQGLGLAAYNNVVASTLAKFASGSTGAGFPFTGSADITGSLQVTGSATFETGIGGNDFFIIKSGSVNPVKFNGEGIMQFANTNFTPSAVAGGIYYSASQWFLGVE